MDFSCKRSWIGPGIWALEHQYPIPWGSAYSRALYLVHPYQLSRIKAGSSYLLAHSVLGPSNSAYSAVRTVVHTFLLSYRLVGTVLHWGLRSLFQCNGVISVLWGSTYRVSRVYRTNLRLEYHAGTCLLNYICFWGWIVARILRDEVNKFQDQEQNRNSLVICT